MSGARRPTPSPGVSVGFASFDRSVGGSSLRDAVTLDFGEFWVVRSGLAYESMGLERGWLFSGGGLP